MRKRRPTVPTSRGKRRQTPLIAAVTTESAAAVLFIVLGRWLLGLS